MNQCLRSRILLPFCSNFLEDDQPVRKSNKIWPTSCGKPSSDWSSCRFCRQLLIRLTWSNQSEGKRTRSAFIKRCKFSWYCHDKDTEFFYQWEKLFYGPKLLAKSTLKGQHPLQAVEKMITVSQRREGDLGLWRELKVVSWSVNSHNSAALVEKKWLICEADFTDCYWSTKVPFYVGLNHQPLTSLTQTDNSDGGHFLFTHVSTCQCLGSWPDSH